jgi:hypothetical protein
MESIANVDRVAQKKVGLKSNLSHGHQDCGGSKRNSSGGGSWIMIGSVSNDGTPTDDKRTHRTLLERAAGMRGAPADDAPAP